MMKFITFLAFSVHVAHAVDFPSNIAFLDDDMSRDLGVLSVATCQERLDECQTETPPLPIEQWKAFLGEEDGSSLDLVRETVTNLETVSFDDMYSADISTIPLGGVLGGAKALQSLILRTRKAKTELDGGDDVAGALASLTSIMDDFVATFGDGIEASGLKPAVDSTQYMTSTFALIVNLIGEICSEQPCTLWLQMPIFVPILFLELFLFFFNIFGAYWYIFFHGIDDDATEEEEARMICSIEMTECSFNRMSHTMVPALLTASFIAASA